MKHRPKTSAFTLVELLTVIAVIGVLAAILIPVVGSARESAKGTQCIGNLRQIGIGLRAYAAENKGRFPRGHPTEGRTLWDTYAQGDPRGAAGLGALQYYGHIGGASNGEVRGAARSPLFDCPSRDTAGWDADANWSDYYYNFVGTYYTAAPDGALVNGVEQGKAVAFDFVPSSLEPVHGRGRSINVLYADGSVVALTKEKFKTSNRQTAFDR